MKAEQKGQAKLLKDTIKASAKQQKEQLKAVAKEVATKSVQPNIKENLKKATTEMLVLLMLRKKSMYAYEMIQHIATVTHNVITFNTLYIAIYRLRDRGLVLEQEKVLTEGNRTRVYFAITADGLRYLEESIAEYTLVTNAIAGMLSQDAP